MKKHSLAHVNAWKRDNQWQVNPYYPNEFEPFILNATFENLSDELWKLNIVAV